MPILLLVLLSAAGVFLWVYHVDGKEREPWLLIIAAFALGFVFMHLAGRVEDFTFNRAHATFENRMWRAAFIAVLEETTKLIPVLIIATVYARYFTNTVDGLIYGRLAGLGVGVCESLQYLALLPADEMTLGGEIVRLWGHSLMGGLVGYAIGLGVQPDGKRKPLPGLMLACLGLAMLVHFLWNVVAYHPQMASQYRFVPMILMVVMMCMWRRMVDYARRQAAWTAVLHPASQVVMVVRQEA